MYKDEMDFAQDHENGTCDGYPGCDYCEAPETDARIRSAFGRMPFGGACGFAFPVDMTLEVVADNLERLVRVLEGVSKTFETERKELRQYQEDTAALRRILGVTK